MLSAYAPAAVVIDEAMHVEQFRGHTEVYLEHTADRSTRNFFNCCGQIWWPICEPPSIAPSKEISRRATGDRYLRWENARGEYRGRAVQNDRVLQGVSAGYL